MDSQVVERADSHSVRVSGPVVIMEWRTSASTAPIAAAEAAFDLVEAEHGRGVARCLVVLDMSDVRRPPTAAVRKAIVDLFRTRQPAATALVLRGHPFQVKAVRAVVWTLHHLVRGDEPMQTFEDPEEALRWLTSEAAAAA